MSKAAGAKKPSESQKATAFRATKAARDREDEFYDQTCKEGNRRDLSCGSILEIPSLLWTKLAVAWRILVTEESGSKHLVKKLSEIQWPAAGRASCKKYGEGPFGKVFGLTWTRGTACACVTSTLCNVPGKYGPHGELLFFLVKKEPVAFSYEVPFKPVFPVETLKAWAVIGLHLWVAGGDVDFSGSQSLDSGDIRRDGS